jgi:AbrB family looped-hinge helix DNA binding protein
MVRKVKAKKSEPAPAQRRGRSTSSRISSQNQITIPIEVLREVNLKHGDQIEFMIDKEERIILAPLSEPPWKRSLRSLAGAISGSGTSLDYIKERK